MLGDNAYVSGTDEEYQAAVFDTYPTILRNTPLWSTLGNHDALSADSPTQTGPYYEAFTFPIAGQSEGVASGTEAYYSFDFGHIHFICLDPSDTPILSVDPMAQWLVNDLQAISTDWIVAYFNQPLFSDGFESGDIDGGGGPNRW